jgi:hypothetical protein
MNVTVSEDYSILTELHYEDERRKARVQAANGAEERIALAL